MNGVLFGEKKVFAGIIKDLSIEHLDLGWVPNPVARVLLREGQEIWTHRPRGVEAG